jgi:hypothetical protein
MKGRFPNRTPSVAASGINFPKLGGDDELIVQYQGAKDISEHIGEKEPAVYLNLFDGVNTFNISRSFKLSQQEWKTGNWYYIHNNGEVETKLNPMIDWEIYELGGTGANVDVDPNWIKGGKLKLVPEVIADLNYTKINNPFRGTKHDPNKSKKDTKKA